MVRISVLFEKRSNPPWRKSKQKSSESTENSSHIVAADKGEPKASTAGFQHRKPVRNRVNSSHIGGAAKQAYRCRRSVQSSRTAAISLAQTIKKGCRVRLSGLQAINSRHVAAADTQRGRWTLPRWTKARPKLAQKARRKLEKLRQQSTIAAEAPKDLEKALYPHHFPSHGECFCRSTINVLQPTVGVPAP